LLLVVAVDVIAVLGHAVGIAQMTLEAGGSLVHRFGVPSRIADKALVLRAEHISVPTERMPGVVLFAHRLGDVPGNGIAGIIFPVSRSITAVLQAVNQVVNTC